jgi:hypothetical protein
MMSDNKYTTVKKNLSQYKNDSTSIPLSPPLNKHDKRVIRPEDWLLNDIDWRPDTSLGFFNNGDCKYIIDSTTGKKYLNDSRMLVRFKCLYPGLIFIPLLSVVAGISNIAYRSIKIFSGYHFWGNLEAEKTYKFTAEIQKDNDKIQQTFKARFDDLSQVNKLINAGSCNLISIEKGESEIYNLLIKTSQGEEIAIKALGTDQTVTNKDCNEVNVTLSNLMQIQEEYDLETRFFQCVKDIVRIAVSLFVIFPLTLSALYGLWKPYEARKLISSIALAVCGTDQVAACFAPSPTFHAMGGDINKPGAF